MPSARWKNVWLFLPLAIEPCPYSHSAAVLLQLLQEISTQIFLRTVSDVYLHHIALWVLLPDGKEAGQKAGGVSADGD